MRVYHWTSAENASLILAEGFATISPEEAPRAYWVSDSRLGANDGVLGAGVVELDCPTALFTEFESIDVGKAYREALIPAARLNADASFIVRPQ